MKENKMLFDFCQEKKTGQRRGRFPPGDGKGGYAGVATGDEVNSAMISRTVEIRSILQAFEPVV
jgi:hypothetical protein